jgi:hypothetical protein
VRQAHRRVFVYLPLVGENRDNDEKNDRARACEPNERLGGHACASGRHRFSHLAWTRGGRQGAIVPNDRTTPLTMSGRPVTV